MDLRIVAPLVYKYLDEYRVEAAVGHAFVINVNPIPYLYQESRHTWAAECGGDSNEPRLVRHYLAARLGDRDCE